MTTLPSLADRVRTLEVGAPTIAIHSLPETFAFVLSAQDVVFVGDTEQRVSVHDGGILASVCDVKRLITGGDDGKIIETDGAGASRVIAEDGKRRWIDHLALHKDGAIAWSAGKHVFARTSKGERSIELPSTPGGLAFAPKGLRLAIAHYNGASLWFPNAEATPERLDWKGSHLGITWSPNGQFLVTSMQEPTLHGWRIVDNKHMRMAGYAGRVRSMSWSHNNDWLATSGSNQLILWPFHSKDGPIGKEPRLLAERDAQVTIVACHPRQPVAAAAYADGTVLLIRLDDGAQIVVRKGDDPVTALAFDHTGQKLAFGTEFGSAGVLDF